MNRVFGILGKVAQVALPVFGPIGGIASSVVGGLTSAHYGLPGLLSGLTVGLGGNFTGGFLSGFGVSLYVSNHDFRAGINEAVGAVLVSIKNVIL